MNIYKVAGTLYWCDGCEEWRHEVDVSNSTYYWHDEHELASSEIADNSGHSYVFTERCGEIEIVTCDACETTINEDNCVDVIYRCGECDAGYEDTSDAVACCR